jgi:undecaprenyl diphosphate synthase
MRVSTSAGDAAPRSLPRHVAIIMDGNGRWAQSRGLPRIAGHRRGAEAVRRTVAGAIELGIPYLTWFCCVITCSPRSPNCTATASA